LASAGPGGPGFRLFVELVVAWYRPEPRRSVLAKHVDATRGVRVTLIRVEPYVRTLARRATGLVATGRAVPSPAVVACPDRAGVPFDGLASALAVTLLATGPGRGSRLCMTTGELSLLATIPPARSNETRESILCMPSGVCW
jgi:hypothetical protein